MVADVLGARARGGPVLAAFQMAADLGAIVGPLAAGAMADHWTFPAAFTLTGAMAVLALLVWLAAPETLPRRAPTPEVAAAQAVTETEGGQADPGSDGRR